MVENFWGSSVLLINLVPTFFLCHFGITYFDFMKFLISYEVKCFLFAANAVLAGACERVIVGDLYCDIPLGLYVIRGENVVLIGELVSICNYIPL